MTTPAPDRPWRLDPALAADLAAAIGWQADHGVAALGRALNAHLLAGSTAKLAAIAAGEVPPGADVATLARTAVADLASDRPRRSWTCWPFCTLAAALVEASGLGRAEVVACRRTDQWAPVVDVHGAVLITVDGRPPLLTDPYFAAVIPGPADDVPLEPGTEATRHELPDGRWWFDLRLHWWDAPLTFQLLSPALGPDDVRLYCAMSVRFSGAPFRPYARLGGPIEAVSLTEGDDGTATLSDTRGAPAEKPAEPFPSWAAGAEAFAARTGVRLA